MTGLYTKIKRHELTRTVAPSRAPGIVGGAVLSETAFVEAADEARVPLERDLHDGAQQRLLAIGIALNLIEDQPVDDLLLANAKEEVARARCPSRGPSRPVSTRPS